MERRTFLTALAGGLLATPLAAEAQTAGKVPRVGYLAPFSRSDPQVQRYHDLFRQGLRDLGYIEGQNIAIEWRWTEGTYEPLPDLAAELVRLKVDVIVAAGGVPAAQAAKQATKTIPIIMVVNVDPVAAGLVASLARPGGNVTGLVVILHGVVGKELQMLREMVPKASLVAVLWNPADPANAPQLREAEVAARALGVRLQALGAQGPSEIDGAFAAMTRKRAGALLVLVDAMLMTQRQRIADLGATHRLPAVYGSWIHAEAGGLMTYSYSFLDLARHLASYVDRILKGAQPSDLPVKQPNKFELIINLKTAKALGLTIPPSLLARADEVVE